MVPEVNCSALYTGDRERSVVESRGEVINHVFDAALTVHDWQLAMNQVSDAELMLMIGN